MVKKIIRYLSAVVAASLLFGTTVQAQALLMTLSVESAQVEKDYEFVLTLEIYAPASPNPPDVTIDGITQFEIGRRRRNLQQVPGGRTVKWIFQYGLTPHENGGFKLGPARAESGPRSYYSNTLFITVEGRGIPGKRESPPKPPESKPKITESKPKLPESKPKVPESKPKAPEAKPKVPESKPKEPEPKPKEPEPEPEIVEPPKPVELPKPITDADIGDKISIVMESTKTRAYRGEGVIVTFRLLSQYPVENLSYLVEPEFPGFLKYDFPFTTQPKAQQIKRGDNEYVTYELQRFLIFPIDPGVKNVPPVSCALKVRIPATIYDFADTRLDIKRNSNSIRFQVEPVDSSVLVGRFTLQNEIVSDAPQIKVVRFILNGEGQLSTFDFPSLKIPEIGEIRPATTSTDAKLQGDRLKSRKIADFQIFYNDVNTTNVVLPGVSIRQLDPSARNFSWLRLPSMKLLFEPQRSLTRAEISVPLPETKNSPLLYLLVACTLPLLVVLVVALWPERVTKSPKLRSLLRKKNPKLQISKNASLWLYQQILKRLAAVDQDGRSMIETMKQHLPEEDWLRTERVFRRLEFNAFARATPVWLTYGELQEACVQLEKRWLL